ncbi:RING-type E3 ubiquitin transferase [Ranunculus cassubicifolius]
MILISLFLAFLLPCIGMTTVILVYIFLIWCTTTSANNQEQYGSGHGGKEPCGLSELELKKLPCSVACRELKEMECVVCLEGIEVGQMVRLLPDCHHGFHLQCADAWLSKHNACPICRHEFHFDDEEKEKSSPENIV